MLDLLSQIKFVKVPNLLKEHVMLTILFLFNGNIGTNIFLYKN